MPADTMESRLTTTKAEVREKVLRARSSGKLTGVVMTMGALHEGHLSLVDACTRKCEFTVVTIFVNPTQFLPGEDLEAYPKTLDTDLEQLSRFPVDVVFAPRPLEVYGRSFSTYIEPPNVAATLEGICRPHHFRGVCTVVFKLLQMAPAEFAFFGEKDYQQFLVVQRMAEDLDLAVNIVPCPTVREADGLALSSRNLYLNHAERQRAVAISRGLFAARDLVRDGTVDAVEIAAHIRQELVGADITRIDYIAIADPLTLADVRTIDRDAVALVAAYVGETRLIDNIRLIPSSARVPPTD